MVVIIYGRGEGLGLQKLGSYRRYKEGGIISIYRKEGMDRYRREVWREGYQELLE